MDTDDQTPKPDSAIYSDLRAQDFTQVNFGIWTWGDNPTDSYVFQLPSPFDKKRAAQSSPLAFIGKKQHSVSDFAEALVLFNDHRKNDSELSSS